MINKKAYIEFIFQKLNDLLSELENEQESIDDEIGKETKSSAGDKFETSREMMSQARERIDERMSSIGLQIRTLKNIQPNEVFTSISHGSLVETDKGVFFFGLSLEKLVFEKQSVFNLSMASPIGKVFQDKIKGNSVPFRNTTYQIIEIS